MKKDVNGVIVEMTEEEEIEAMKAEVIEIPPTETERIEAMENALLELAEVLANG